MNNLPKVTKTNIICRKGVTILQMYIERKGWLFRRQDGETDFGVDGEIELVSNNQVTGQLFKIQIKSTQNIVWNNNQTTIRVKTSTYNLWHKMPLPIVLFLVDTSTEKVYWSLPLAYSPQSNADTMSVKFEKTSDFEGKGMYQLEDYMNSWFSNFNFTSFLNEIPYYHKTFEDFYKKIYLYDDWCCLNEMDLDLFNRFYGYVERFRLHLGFSNAGIPSLNDWYIRDTDMWNGGSVEFYWATFSEAMTIITPFYQEAFKRFVKRFEKVEMDFSNQTLKRFLARREYGDPFTANLFISPLRNDSQLHEFLEVILYIEGGLKYRFPNKVFQT